MNAALSIDASGLDHSLLTAEQERDATPEQLVVHNLRLVARTATAYARKLHRAIDAEDLFGAGVLGLMIAADRFEPVRGHRVSSFATWWIRQRITRAIADEVRPIRLPVHIQDKLRRRAKNGEQPVTECEAAAARIVRARMISTHPLDDGEDFSGLELIDERPDPFEVARLSEIKARVHEAVAQTLDEREAEIVSRRFGLDGPPESLESIGRTLGCTREWVRQLEREAMGKLRNLAPELADL